MRVEDVYLLVLHEPYESPEHPVPTNATIVHASTLLHPTAPQPDGGRMYRCLTEFPPLPSSLSPGNYGSGLGSPAVPVWLIAPCSFYGLGGVAPGMAGA